MNALQNYRVTFGGTEINYKSNFSECRKYLPIIYDLFEVLKNHGVKDYWYFFEPYVEITWLWNDRSDAIDIIENVAACLNGYSIQDYQFSLPEFCRDDGEIVKVEFADWYYGPGNYAERQFGCESYAASARLAKLFYRYRNDIERGKGLENQYMRRCHVLANQLGLDYKREGILLLKRSILCFLFWFLGHRKAVWIYTKILRQKY